MYDKMRLMSKENPSMGNKRVDDSKRMSFVCLEIRRVRVTVS